MDESGESLCTIYGQGWLGNHLALMTHYKWNRGITGHYLWARLGNHFALMTHYKWNGGITGHYLRARLGNHFVLTHYRWNGNHWALFMGKAVEPIGTNNSLQMRLGNHWELQTQYRWDWGTTGHYILNTDETGEPLGTTLNTDETGEPLGTTYSLQTRLGNHWALMIRYRRDWGTTGN